MKHICIITARYPTSVDSISMVFVQQLAWAMADEGNKISVICPLAVNLNHNFMSVSDHLVENTYTGKQVDIYFPKCMGFGQRTVACFNTATLTTALFKSAVKKVLAQLEKPDVLYGHFVTPSGIVACEIGKEMDVPAFIAYGESSTWSIDHIGRKRVKRKIENVAGVVSVSTANKTEIVNTEVVPDSKVEVFPNGYLKSRFSPKDKSEARKKYNIPEDTFVVAFVGHFIERKGITVLTNAVESLDDVYMICAGKGKRKPEGDRVLFADSVNPDELAWFYSAADVFVLPTLNEGCCNAIIEAIACGVPVISSDRAFNNDILDGTNSIRVDPTNEVVVAEAIEALKTNMRLRQSLAQGCLEKAKELTLEVRAKKIIGFIERKSL